MMSWLLSAFVHAVGCVVVYGAIFAVVCKVIERFLRRLMIDGVTDKHVFVTGCDSGFGELLAKRLDGMGCHVYAGCLTKEGMEKLKEASSSRLTTVSLDVRDSDSIQRAYELVERKVPKEGLWGVVNNAGILLTVSPAEWQYRDREEHRRLLEVNTLGMMEVATRFLPLVRRSRGRLVFMASIGAVCPFPWAAAYVASKSGILGFAETLREEIQCFGVQVSSILPSARRTNIFNAETFASNSMAHFDNLPVEAQQAYGRDNVTQVLAYWHTLIRTCSVNLHDIVDAYQHALFARYPRVRYIVPPGTTSLILQSYLPKCVVSVMSALTSRSTKASE